MDELQATEKDPCSPLNLYLPDDLIEQVKVDAVRKKRSVSKIVADMLRSRYDEGQAGQAQA